MGAFKRNLLFPRIFLSGFVLTLGACGGGGSSSNEEVTQVSSDIAESGASTETTGLEVATRTVSLAGNVSNGLAFPDASLDVVWADGEQEGVGTTNANGDYDITVPDGADFPLVLRAQKSDGSWLETVVTGEDKDIVNLNPITTVVSQLVLGENGAENDERDFTGIDEELFQQTGEAITETLFGEGVDFTTFESEPFKARTEGDAESGGLADTLMDVVGGLDPQLPIADIIASAIDPNDSTFEGELLEDPGFQTRLAGELIGQGRSLDDARKVIAEAAPAGDNPDVPPALINQAGGFLEAFDGVRAQAEQEGVDPEAMEHLIQSSAMLAADFVDGTVFDDTEELGNLVDNVLNTAGPALVDVVGNQENQDLIESGDIEHMMRAMAGEVSEVLGDIGGDLTRVLPPEEFEALHGKMGHFAEVMGGPMADGLRDPSLEGLAPEEIAILMNAMGHHLGDHMGGFIGDLGEGEIPPEVLNAAHNMGGPLFNSMIGVMNDEDVQGMDIHKMHEMVGAVGDISAEQLQKLDLGQENLDLGAMENLLHNLGLAAAGMAGDSNDMTDELGDRASAAVLGATLGQTLGTLMDLEAEGKFDLRGGMLPPEAMMAADNIAQLVGPALAGSVADLSNRGGDELDMLLNGAAAGAMQELRAGVPDLTSEFNRDDYMQLMDQHAVESAIALEQTFQQIEAAGIPLHEIMHKFGDVGLAPEAIAMVASQVATAFGPGENPDDMPPEAFIDAAHIYAEMAAESANRALDVGGTLEEARDMVAMTTGTLLDVGEMGGFHDIKNSAFAMMEGMEAAAATGEISYDDFQNFTQDMGVVIAGAAEQHFIPVDENGNPLPPPEGVPGDQPYMPPPGEHVNFDDLIGSFHQFDPSHEGGMLTMEQMAANAPVGDMQNFDEKRMELERMAMEQAENGEQMMHEFDQLAEAAILTGGPGEENFQEIFDEFNAEHEKMDLPEGVNFEEFVERHGDDMPPPDDCMVDPSRCPMPPATDGTFIDDGTYVDDGTMPPPADGGYIDDGTMPPPADGGYIDDGTMPPPADGGYVDDGSTTAPPPPPADGGYIDDGTMPPPADGGYIDDGTMPPPADGGHVDDGAMPPPADGGYVDDGSTAAPPPADGGYVDDGTMPPPADGGYVDDGTMPPPADGGHVDDGSTTAPPPPPPPADDGHVDDGSTTAPPPPPPPPPPADDGYVDDGSTTAPPPPPADGGHVDGGSSTMPPPV